MIRRWYQWLLNVVQRDLWLVDTDALPIWRGRSINLARTLTLTGHRLQSSNTGLHARSLTAITLLMMVPIFAFLFTMAKGFGVYQLLQEQLIHPGLDQWLNGREAPELRAAVNQIFNIVESTNLQSLGLAGLSIAALSTYRLLDSTEHALNDLWDVSTSRPIRRKIVDYAAVLIIVPAIMLLATTTTTALTSDRAQLFIAEYTTIAPGLLRGSVLLFVWLGFSCLYLFLPNVDVRPRAAFLGGILGGSLWLIMHMAHIRLQVGVAHSSALYASFSAFPVFLFWLYTSWLAVLSGAAFAAAVQLTQAHRDRVIKRLLSVPMQSVHAVAVASAVAERWTQEENYESSQHLATALGIPLVAVELAVSNLATRGLLAKTEEQQVTLTRAPERIRLQDLILASHGPAVSRAELPDAGSILDAHQAIERFRSANSSSSANPSLTELIALKAVET